jgi:Fe-S-cluster containining protein
LAREFFFRCQRSGNCCRVGTGRVWLKDGEAEAIAGELGLSQQGFADRHLVAVDGRISLRERADGRCVLLEGSCHCTAYAARPQQCRDYPDWPILRDDPTAFERAAAYCPGIQQLPEPEPRRAGMQALLDVMAEQPVPEGRAPCLRASGPRPVSSLETDAFLQAFPHASSTREQPCPALEGESCKAGQAAPGICRNLPPERGFQLERQIQSLAENCGYPWSKADWTVILPDRVAAWHASELSLSVFDV